MAADFSLFTSVRYDPQLLAAASPDFDHAGWNHANKSPFYMLDFHRDRILRAATHWGWQPAVDALTGDQGLKSLAAKAQEYIGSSQTTPLRFKIIVDRTGHLKFEKHDTPELPLSGLLPRQLAAPGTRASLDDRLLAFRHTLTMDDDLTNRSEFTHFKTTERTMYDSARQRAGLQLGELREVLIVNRKDGSVMEGSTSTPYFWRDGRWVTPKVSSGFSREDGSGGQDGTTRRWALEHGLVTEQTVPVASLVDGEECWMSTGVRGFLPAVVSLSR